jgi:hypothetical protein
MRVIDRVHRYASHRWANTPPPACAGFTKLAQIVLAMTDLTDSGPTIGMYPAHFT